MNQLNRKGFTLIEVIAVVAIISILGLVAVPNVLKTIEKSRQTTYDILVANIATASKQLYEEVDFVGTLLYHYDMSGKLMNSIQIVDDKIVVTLQTLVSNGFLNGSNNPNQSVEGNNNDKIIVNSKTKEDIGDCEIIITKIVSGIDFETSYKIENASSFDKCPTTEEYEKISK